MLLLGTILLIGVLLGFGLGGDIRNLATAELRLWWLLPVAVALQVAPIPRGEGTLGVNLPFATLILSFVVIALVCVVNWGLRGFPTLLLGVLLNLIPISVNQGMPVSAEAVVEVGGSVEDVPTQPGAKHHLATPEDRLTILGDSIAVREPFKAVVSIGDIVMWIGAALFVTAAMLARERRTDVPPPHPHRARPSTRSGT
ncbi:MAG: DUF5317 domain-containing protein, partial [Actinomycetota bacterium]|nr:DUF5317 domain-containing protein [Actinomycetota bacterium]